MLRSFDDGTTREVPASHAVKLGRYFAQRAARHPECARNVEVRCRECCALVKAVQKAVEQHGRCYASTWNQFVGPDATVEPFVLPSEGAPSVEVEGTAVEAAAEEGSVAAEEGAAEAGAAEALAPSDSRSGVDRPTTPSSPEVSAAKAATAESPFLPSPADLSAESQ